MESTILVFFSPKETAISVPKIGLKSSGVRKAMPIRPYLRQMRTMRRLRGVKVFRFLKKVLSSQSRIGLPPQLKKRALLVVPALVASTVSKTDKWRLAPAKGAKINLKVAKKKT